MGWSVAKSSPARTALVVTVTSSQVCGEDSSDGTRSHSVRRLLNKREMMGGGSGTPSPASSFRTSQRTPGTAVGNRSATPNYHKGADKSAQAPVLQVDPAQNNGLTARGNGGSSDHCPATENGKALVRKLEDVGFDVIHLVDPDEVAFEESITLFQRRLKVLGGIALFYYSGKCFFTNTGKNMLTFRHSDRMRHVQWSTKRIAAAHGGKTSRTQRTDRSGGATPLVSQRSSESKDGGADMDEEDHSVRVGAVPLEVVQWSLQTAGHSGPSIVMIENGVGKEGAKPKSMRFGDKLGLRFVAPSSFGQSGGNFLAFASAVETEPKSGTGRHSIFTSQVIRNIDLAGLELRDFGDCLSQGVSNETSQTQEPHIQHQLDQPFYFVPLGQQQTKGTRTGGDRVDKYGFDLVRHLEMRQFCQSNFTKEFIEVGVFKDLLKRFIVDKGGDLAWLSSSDQLDAICQRINIDGSARITVSEIDRAFTPSKSLAGALAVLMDADTSACLLTGLPGKNESMLGRHDDVENIVQTVLLEKGKPINIHGPEGIGKSTVMVSIGHDVVTKYRGGFFEGVLYFKDLRGLRSVKDFIRSVVVLASELRVETLRTEEIFMTFVRQRQNGFALFLDHCDTILENEEVQFGEFLKKMLRANPSVQIVMCSCKPLSFCNNIELRPFDKSTTSKALAWGAGLMDHNFTGCNELAAAVGGVPLNVKLAASLLENDGVGSAPELTSQIASMSSSGKNGAIEIALQKVSQAAISILKSILAFPSTFSTEIAAAISSLNVSTTYKLLGELSQLGLVQQLGQSTDEKTARFSLHDAVHNYLHLKWGYIVEAQQAFVTHYAEVLLRYAKLSDSGMSISASGLLDRDLKNISCMLTFALEVPIPEAAAITLSSMPVLRFVKQRIEWKFLHDVYQAIGTRDEMGRRAKASVQAALGVVKVMLGKEDVGYQLIKKASRELRALLDSEHPDLGEMMWGVGLAFLMMGSNSRALGQFAMSLGVKMKHVGAGHFSVVETLKRIRSVYGEEKQPDRALQQNQWILRIESSTLGNNHPALGTTLQEIGRNYRDMGNYKAALEALTESLSIVTSACGSEHPAVALILADIGDVCVEKNDFETARDSYVRAAVMVRRTLGQSHTTAHTLLSKLTHLDQVQGVDRKSELEELFKASDGEVKDSFSDALEGGAGASTGSKLRRVVMKEALRRAESQQDFSLVQASQKATLKKQPSTAALQLFSAVSMLQKDTKPPTRRESSVSEEILQVMDNLKKSESKETLHTVQENGGPDGNGDGDGEEYYEEGDGEGYYEEGDGEGYYEEDGGEG